MAQTTKQRRCNRNNNETGNDNSCSNNVVKNETNTHDTLLHEEKKVIDIVSLMNKRKKSKQTKSKYDKLQSVVVVIIVIASAIALYLLLSSSPSTNVDKKTGTEELITSQELQTLQSFLGDKQTLTKGNLQRIWQLALHLQPLLHKWSIAEYDRVNKGNTRERSNFGKTKRHEKTIDAACVELKNWADTIYNNAQVTFAETKSHSPHRPSTCEVALATFIYEHLLTEFAMLHDNVKDHTVVLLRTLHMLHDWNNFTNTDESINSNAVNTSLCNQCLANVHHNNNINRNQTFIDKGVEQWQQFCNSSITSYDAMMTRSAAILEELIVLHPYYIPFRLQYITAFLLRDSFVNISTNNITSIQRANKHIQIAKQLIKFVNDRVLAAATTNSTNNNVNHDVFIAIIDLLQLHLSMLQSLLNFNTSLHAEHNYSAPLLSKANVKKKVEHILSELDNTTIYKSIIEDNTYWYTEDEHDNGDDKSISAAMAAAWDKTQVQLSLITPRQLQLVRRTLQQVVNYKLFTSSLRSKISQLITKLK